MFKKVFVFLSLIIFIALLISGYLYLKDRNKPIPSLIKAIPIDAAIIVESEDFSSLLNVMVSDNKLFNLINKVPEFDAFISGIKFIDSLSSLNEEIHNILISRPIALSAHLSGNNKLDFLYLVKLEDFTQENAANNLINQFNFEQKTRNYEKAQINTLYKNKRVLYSYSIYSGLVFICKKDILIESAIRQLSSSPKINDLDGFQQIYSTAGENVDANFFINFQQFKKVAQKSLASNLSGALSKNNNFANWSEMDVSIHQDNILLNGYSSVKDSTKLFLNIFKGQPVAINDIQKVVPSNTALFVMASISDYNLYLNNYKNYFAENRNTSFLKSFDELQENTTVDIREILSSMIDDQLALIITNNKQLSFDENTYVVIKTNSRSSSLDKMKALIKSYGNGNSSIKSQTLNIDNETKIETYKLPFEQFAYDVFGNIFSWATCNYFCFIDNYMILGHSSKSLKSFVHQNLLHKTFENDIAYQEFNENLSNKSNFFVYNNFSISDNLYQNLLHENIYNIYKKNKTVFNDLQAVGYQLNESHGMFYGNLFLNYNPAQSNTSATLWESHLDTLVRSKPYIVRNHYVKQKEIIVQDYNNNLYLINYNGRILWKKKLTGPISSEIFQVDYYKNGKLQYLFNTKTQILLIDRNGNYVERYPINLPSSATNGLSVFDYDNNGDYRIFIALENKEIKVYNKEGNIVPGWGFKRSEYPVKKDINHFRVSGKDYIVFADSIRLYILNRKGKERVKPDNQFRASPRNSLYLDESGNTPRIVTTDISGHIKFIYFNGKVKTQIIDEFSENHYFNYTDINSDHSPDYIFVDNKQLKIFNKSGKQIVKYLFKSDIRLAPAVYNFSAFNKKIGIVAEADQSIYLFDGEGNLTTGFPLEGLTLFSIGKLNPEQEKYNLIVGGKDNFLYNYYLN